MPSSRKIFVEMDARGKPVGYPTPAIDKLVRTSALDLNNDLLLVHRPNASEAQKEQGVTLKALKNKFLGDVGVADHEHALDYVHRALADCLYTLQRSTVWDKLDLLYFPCLDTWARSSINWRNPVAFNLTQYDEENLFFMPLKGTANKSDGGYLSTGFSPLTNGIAFQNDSCHIAMYMTEHGEAKSDDLFFSKVRSDNHGNLGVAEVDGTISLNIQSEQSNSIVALGSEELTVGDPLSVKTLHGFHTYARLSNVIAHWHNGNLLGQESVTDPKSLPSSPLLLLRSGAKYCGHTVSFMSAGAALTFEEVNVLYTAVRKFLFKIGAVPTEQDLLNFPRYSKNDLLSLGVEHVKFKPLLDVDFSNLEAEPPIEYTRAGEIFEVGSDGYLYEVAVDTLPHRWHPLTGDYEGVRTFKGFTQIETHSGKFDELHYVKTGVDAYQFNYTDEADGLPNFHTVDLFGNNGDIWRVETLAAGSSFREISREYTVAGQYILFEVYARSFPYLRPLHNHFNGLIVKDRDGVEHGVAWTNHGLWDVVIGDPSKIIRYKFEPMRTGIYRMSVVIDVGEAGANDPVCIFRMYKPMNLQVDDVLTDFPIENVPDGAATSWPQRSQPEKSKRRVELIGESVGDYLIADYDGTIDGVPSCRLELLGWQASAYSSVYEAYPRPYVHTAGVTKTVGDHVLKVTVPELVDGHVPEFYLRMEYRLDYHSAGFARIFQVTRPFGVFTLFLLRQNSLSSTPSLYAAFRTGYTESVQHTVPVEDNIESEWYKVFCGRNLLTNRTIRGYNSNVVTPIRSLKFTTGPLRDERPDAVYVAGRPEGNISALTVRRITLWNDRLHLSDMLAAVDAPTRGYPILECTDMIDALSTEEPVYLGEDN